MLMVTELMTLFLLSLISTLFNAGVDYNDGTAILTFFGAQYAPLGFQGFLTPGDTGFDYTAVFFDVRSGDFNVQVGRIDLADEVVPAAASFGLAAGDVADLPASGAGYLTLHRRLTV
ncbi:MAG: hypothetical protein ACJAVI_001500 [Candidatus Azotimanducaceae bacterium]|jgi:hypothetical protein